MARTRLIDKGYKRIQRELLKMGASEVAIGILGESALEADENGFSLVDVAAVNEFGSDDGHVPERPAHRDTFERVRGQAGIRAEIAVNNVLHKGGTSKKQLNRLGLWYVGELQQEITAFDDPPNAPATIAKKGADNPLIDTGRMKNSIQHEVRPRER